MRKSPRTVLRWCGPVVGAPRINKGAQGTKMSGPPSALHGFAPASASEERPSKLAKLDLPQSSDGPSNVVKNQEEIDEVHGEGVCGGYCLIGCVL